MAKIEQKVEANRLPFWSIFASFSTGLKTVQKQRFTVLESILKQFLTCF